MESTLDVEGQEVLVEEVEGLVVMFREVKVQEGVLLGEVQGVEERRGEVQGGNWRREEVQGGVAMLPSLERGRRWHLHHCRLRRRRLSYHLCGGW